MAEHAKELVEALKYHGSPCNGSKLRAAFKEFTGKKFTECFPKPGPGVSFTEFVKFIIEEYDLEL